MEIKKLERQNLSQEVIEQIKDQIITGKLLPGTKIPPEMELSKRFGVSRVTIREAINQLIGRGILSIKRGEGTFVNKTINLNCFDDILTLIAADDFNLLEILEFRSMIEIESAKLAALRATKEDIIEMKKYLKKMQENIDKDHLQYCIEGLNFHNAIIMATHNKLFREVGKMMYKIVITFKEKLLAQDDFSQKRISSNMSDHKNILKAIENKDPGRAYDLMRTHVEGNRGRLIKSIEWSQLHDTQ